jgi:hypothetical protein
LIPVPPATSERPVAVYDTECYPNFWLLKLKSEHGHIYSFPLYEGQRFDGATKLRMRNLFELFCVVSFNGIYYDVPMIAAALEGYDPAGLKQINDRIIVEGMKPWELNLPDWAPADHIDVMEVAPGIGGQKQYAGRIHCKTMQDLPYDPGTSLTPVQIIRVSDYCENDLAVLEALYNALQPQIQQRKELSKRYGIDLRSKSDAQLAEAVLRLRCELATGRRIYKPNVDWNLQFTYQVPDYIQFATSPLQRALELVRTATFRLGASGSVVMPSTLEGLEITIGTSTYKIGIGGLHSQEKKSVHVADDEYAILDIDVASYYPSLMLNSGAWPTAMGPTFLKEYEAIKDERLAAKALQGQLKKAGDTSSPKYIEALTGNEGGKIMINGTFGKTGSPYSVLFAPEMLIQTTVTGQLSLLMLIEWHAHYGIQVVSANTDGMVIKCRRDQIYISEHLVKEWETRTGLTMESVEYRAIYARDVNNYIAIKTDGEAKRKGEYSKAGLIEKKNPDVEICSDAVAEFLSNGTHIAITIQNCRDIRKFVTIQKVSGGGVKMWGEGPRKDIRVRELEVELEKYGWVKVDKKQWRRGDIVVDRSSAYQMCFEAQRPEYLGKVVRWYYGTNSPGPIVYASNGNTVSLSYGATPCMTLPDEFPSDIDYAWYIQKADDMLRDLGYYDLR